MLPTESSELNRIKKSFVIQYLYVILIVLFCFSVFYWYENMFPLNYLSVLGFMFHLFVATIPHRINFLSLRSLIPIYLFFLSLMLYPFIVILWWAGQVTAFIWYFLIPFGTMIIFSFRIVFYWSIFILFLIGSIFFIVEFQFVQDFVHPFSDRQLSLLNIITILLSLCFVGLILHYMNKIYMLQMPDDAKNKPNVESTSGEKIEDLENKFNELYDIIVKYIESEHPYCDPDFNIAQMATKLNTNITYISRAIRVKKNTNFAFFINIYRINKVKEMIQKDYHNKYTLKFIYTSAGFKHQSTFNKVFKQIEKVTPSEYISKEK